ncbi:unnamed protein product [Leptosia nina]|uniref:Uncharacterized protein n=1 Tax=Leptosia nina TaxID=320188 RepID=A0AAV1J0X6_9NEOP
MTLLSTLAALVIIVHTAEEEYERAQRGMRARSMDVGPPGYEQTWRAMEMQPKSADIPEGESWRNASPDDGSKRRRNMRKRKRRPQIEDDLLTQERHILPANNPQSDPDYFIAPPDAIRRRKKHNRKHGKEHLFAGGWGDGVDIERPVRRRGHRRKRPPTVEPWPELSEFGDLRPHYDVPVDAEWAGKKEEPIDNDEPVLNEHTNQEDRDDEETPDTYPQADNEAPELSVSENTFAATPQSDRSLSEFSLESLIKRNDEDFKITEVKPKEIVSERNKELIDIAKSNEPLEPLTLKAILKRSNGRSLSEILQQHNLSLSDLLQGREKALSLLKTDKTKVNDDYKKETGDLMAETKDQYKHMENTTSLALEKSVTSNNERIRSEHITSEDVNDAESKLNSTEADNNVETINDNKTVDNVSDDTTKIHTRRRFPFNLRRKLRTRPTNNTFKGQLSRDLMALTTRKYQNSRNIQRTREWVEYMPGQTKRRRVKPEISSTEGYVTESSNPITTTQAEETTTEPLQTNGRTEEIDFSISSSDFDINTSKSIIEPGLIVSENTPETEEIFTTVNVIDTTATPVTEKIVTITQKPKIISHIRTILNSADMRRQALSNRLKRKRLRQKNLSNDSRDAEKDISKLENYVNMQSASEFMGRTQPSTLNTDSENDITTLEDFMSTESVIKPHNRMRSTKPPHVRSSLLPKIQPYLTATEETAKFEIEEILNDTMTRARLARILRERNMTLNELVEHRERGSSHVHLADIFHNASREPNPAEPFLSKSLIEPISKEIYPLRALLEANLHDPKTNIDENGDNSNYLNIPVVMDFGNNVNENGENMGIMSLFVGNNNTSQLENIDIKETVDLLDSMVPQIINKTIEQKPREGRVISPEKGLVNWNELFKLLHNQSNAQDLLEPRMSSKAETLQKILLEDDEDSDGVIVFEDIQPLEGNNIGSSNEENIEVRLSQKAEEKPISVHTSSSNARSVTVVTASIIGLALVLFLLTYAAFKWKQQSKIIDNKVCSSDDRLPSPIFENRKGNMRSSTRSKSPMLTSNIYSINTLDTHAGAESPEYMWDSLRKPFQ